MINYTPTPNFYDDYIAHYGVLGMRWGHRKKELRSIGLTRKQARRAVKLEKRIQKDTETRKKMADEGGKGNIADIDFRDSIRNDKKELKRLLKNANKKNRERAQKDYEQHKKYYVSHIDPNGRVKVKMPFDKKPTEMSRYQSHFEYTDKKKRIGYEYIQDMLNKTAVSKEKMKISKSGLSSTSLGFEKLNDGDFEKIESRLKDYKVSEIRPSLHDKRIAKKHLKKYGR